MALLVSGPAGLLAPRIAGAARSRGARVALTTPGRCEDQTGAAGIPSFRAALSSEADADRLLDAALGELSGLDVVVTVVAAEPLDSLHELTLSQWHGRVATPLRQAFWLAQRTVDEFVSTGHGGRLVFVVEPADGPSERDANGVLEQALLSFARSIAKEYGRRAVVSNLVLPARRAAGRRAPGSDPLHPIVEAALFLASRAASFVNGEALAVDT